MAAESIGSRVAQRHHEVSTLAGKAESDRLVMLLSADWFVPHWQSLGLVLSHSECTLVQAIARDVVREFTENCDSYWNVNFTEQRVGHSKNSFIAGLKARDLSDTARAQLTDLMTKTHSRSDAAKTTLWLFGALTDQLVAAAAPAEQPRIAPATLATIKSLWEGGATSKNSHDDFETSALTSNTKWDQYLRRLTPDLPTYLSDWASNALGSPDRFRRFWAELFWVTSNMERETLRKWYAGEAKKVADPAFVLEMPEWMRTD